jgi:hypothetical protein
MPARARCVIQAMVDRRVGQGSAVHRPIVCDGKYPGAVLRQQGRRSQIKDKVEVLRKKRIDVRTRGPGGRVGRVPA